MTTCVAVATLRAFVDGVSAVTSMAVIDFNKSGAHLHSRDTERNIAISAALKVHVEGQGCAKVHIPTLRQVLKMAPPREMITLSIDAAHTKLAWGNQTHRMPHLNLGTSEPMLSPFEPVAVFRTDNASECLKFCRDVNEDTMLLKADGTNLYLTNPGDLCVSELQLNPAPEILESVVNSSKNQSMQFTATCATDAVLIACKGAAFAPIALVAVGWNNLLFHFHKPDGFISILIPRTK